MQKILLINPPAQKHFIRDLYCSKLASGSYYWEPVDLSVLSGILDKDFLLKAVDCIVENINHHEVLKLIKKEKFDIIISLIGSATLSDDLNFLNEVKKIYNPCIAISGDVVLGEAIKVLGKWNFIDVCITDFTSGDIPVFFKKFKGGNIGTFHGIAYRSKNKIIGDIKEKQNSLLLSLPTPRHDLFPLKKYYLPFFNGSGVAEIVSSLGCPFKCTFCISGTLPFRYRPPREVIKEIKYLTALGIKQIAFRDPLFEGNLKRAKQICELIIKEKLKINWCCNSRVDTILIDKNLLPLMAIAGCKMILFGVESGDDKVLKSVNKRISITQTEKAFTACRKNKIGTSAYVIIGLPEDNNETIQKTIDFTKKLTPDFAIFSIPSPDYRTEIRKYFISENKIQDTIMEFDRGGGKDNAFSTNNLKADEIINWQKKAFRQFYFRQGYILSHLTDFLSPSRIKITIRELMSLIINY